MASNAFSTQFLDSPLEYVNLSRVLQTLGLAVFFGFIIVAVRCMLWRIKVSQNVPGKKVRVFDILGNLTELSYRESSRNGFSFNAFMLQVLCGYAEMFRNQKLFCFWISYTPFVILVKAEAVEALIGSKMIEKHQMYEFLHPWLGTGLLTSSGSKWKSRRKLLTPCFHLAILKDFFPIFNEQAQILVKLLKRETHKEYTDILTPLKLCTLDIICETTLGVSIRAQENSETQYIKSASRAADIVVERAVNVFYWSDFIFDFTKKGKQFKEDLNILHSFTRSVIQEKTKKLMSGDSNVTTSNRKSLMDLLLEHHLQTKTLSEEDIKEEVDTFAFVGHDTSSMAMNWALYLIGLHQEVQAEIHKELDQIFGMDFDRSVTIDDINHMKYLDCVLKESQRIYPTVPFFGRNATEDFQMCGYKIPKGVSYLVLTYSLHRDQDVFPNPEKFDPDRFLPENSINRNPYAFVPFSAGPRNCIGQRFAILAVKVILSTFLRNYTIKSLDQRDKIHPNPELILKPSTSIRIQIRRRQANNL